MPTVNANAGRAIEALRQATKTLKAATVVCAAAILSRAQADLEANAKAALDHFDNVTRQLDALRSGILQDALTISDDEVSIDIDHLDDAIRHFDARIDYTKSALFEITASPERDGLETFVESIGELGRSLQTVVNIVAPPTAAGDAPFLFDQFFLEAMQELSERDWRDNDSM